MTSLERDHPVIVPVFHKIRIIQFFNSRKSFFKTVGNPASFEGYKSEKTKFIPPLAQIRIGFISIAIGKEKIHLKQGIGRDGPD